MTNPETTLPRDRVAALDALRGIALFGVLAVNLVTEFRVSIFEQFLPASEDGSLIDRMIESFVSLALESKAFSLFSLLFGIGLAIQYERFAPLGRPTYWLARRLAVLLLFGLIHLLFVWNGDILTEYALVGFLVLPALQLSNRSLAVVFSSLIALYLAMPLLPLPIAWPSAEALQQHVGAANGVYAQGDFLEIWRFSLAELRLLAPLHIYVVPRTAALFVLGILLWRLGIVRDARMHGASLAVTGFSGVVMGAVMTFRGDLIAPVVLALGYGALVFSLCQVNPTRSALAAFAPLGRMAFTNYLSQSITFCLIFFGYGLGLFGKLGAAQALLLGTAVFIAQMALSALWLTRFQFGPLEWMWRVLTYGKAVPILRRAKRG